MADRMPWDPQRLGAVDRRKLAAAGVDLDDKRVRPYLRNRRTFSDYGEGKRIIDAALHATATDIYTSADELARTVRDGAWAAEGPTHPWDHRGTFRDASHALMAAAAAVGEMQARLASLAAALGVRADDDDNDEAVRRISDALLGRSADS